MRTWERLWGDLPNLTLDNARVFLQHLSRDTHFVTTQVLPHLAPNASAREPYIAATFGAREATTCLQVFIWPVGAATPIHDHTAWGAYQCVAGSLAEERYVRLDDGSLAETARLRKLWRRVWLPSDGASTVGAYENGIHRVANAGRSVAVSLHMYGPRLGTIDGRDYDPSRDYVCDRVEADPPGALLAAL